MSLFFGAAPAATAGWYDVDPSWQTGLNAARSRGLTFGSDLVFTYGPWGFIDHPYTLDRLQFTVGVAVTVAVVAALWFATYAGFRRLVPVRLAVVTASLTVTISATVAETSTLVVTAAGMIVILHLLTARDDGQRVFPIGLVAPSIAVSSGLFLQVKLSTGIAMLVVALVGACAERSWRRGFLTLAASMVCAVVAFLGFWILVGQDVGDIPAWLRGSRELLSGYAEAMALERGDYLFGYVVALGLAGYILVLSVRGALSLDSARGGTLFLLCAVLLHIFLKAAFTRHDQHELTFFVLTAGLLVALAPFAKHRTAALVGVAISMVMIVPDLQRFEVGLARDRWRVALQVVAVSGAADSYSANSKEQGRAVFLLPQGLVDLIGQHPVAVDPFAAALPIDYGMQWHPMPVFQTYVAYTANLDDLNAEAARGAPADQFVLRADDQALDGRNPRWETPAYLLALACDYAAVRREGGWTLLRHAQPRCGIAEQIESQRVSAGEEVTVPEGESDEIVVARFEPDPSNLFSRAFTWAFKDISPFLVNVDGQTFRMPERLAGQPAMMSYPDQGDDGLFVPFGYRSVTYDRPGTVTFERVSTDD